MQKKWEDEITEKKSMLESEYYENVAHVGEGHQAALMVRIAISRDHPLIQIMIKKSNLASLIVSGFSLLSLIIKACAY